MKNSSKPEEKDTFRSKKQAGMQPKTQKQTLHSSKDQMQFKSPQQTNQGKIISNIKIESKKHQAKVQEQSMQQDEIDTKRLEEQLQNLKLSKPELGQTQESVDFSKNTIKKEVNPQLQFLKDQLKAQIRK